jgi:uncharacterized membrane protein
LEFSTEQDGIQTVSWRYEQSSFVQQIPNLVAQSPRISANGLVIAGDTPAAFGASAPARWSAATGVVPVPALSGLPSGRTGVATTALALSADGSILAGSASVRLSQFEFINVPYTWNFASPSASVILNAGSFYLPPSGTFASDLSADGSVFVGFSGQGYVRWSQAEGLTLLGTGPGQLNASARISADGNAVVTGSFYWTTTDGARTIPAVLSAAGANFAGWSNLVATDLSANGLTLCGYGTNPQGQTEGWYATIPAPASLLTLLALPLTTRRRRTPRA